MYQIVTTHLSESLECLIKWLSNLKARELLLILENHPKITVGNGINRRYSKITMSQILKDRILQVILLSNAWTARSINDVCIFILPEMTPICVFRLTQQLTISLKSLPRFPLKCEFFNTLHRAELDLSQAPGLMFRDYCSELNQLASLVFCD